VLVASNWGDWNVKQKNGWDAYHALTHSSCRKLYMGTRWEGHGTPPGDDYRTTVDRWFARWLQGRRNGVERMPAVTSQTSDDAGPIRYLRGPEPRPAHPRLYLGAARDGSWALSPVPLHGAAAATYVDTSTNTEAFAATHPFVGAGYLAFASAPLKHDIRLFGRPVLHLWSTSSGQWVTVTPSLLDLDPAKYAGSDAGTTATDSSAAVALTRGWLDSRFRDGLDHEVPSVAGRSTQMDVALFPTDYTVRKGHRIVLLVQSEDVDWVFPKPLPAATDPTVRVDWSHGQSWLSLPVVG